MKRTLTTIALAFAALVTLQLATVAQASGDEQALKRIEQELIDAMLRNDAVPVERHYADSFTFTTPDGEVLGKAQVVANLKTGSLKFESSKVEEMRVQVYGDAAIVTMRTTDKGRVGGVDVSGQYRWTDFFVRREGRWQLVASQGTRLTR